MWGGGNFSILSMYKTQSFSRLPYHDHLARCLDSNWWIVTPRVGRGWYICSQATLFYQLHLRVTVQCRGWCFFPPLCLCWQWVRPSTHSPSMQSGRPSESSSRHRWGKYNSGIGSPKVASGPLLSEVFGSLPLETWICHIFFMQERGSSRASFYFSLPGESKPVILPISKYM